MLAAITRDQNLGFAAETRAKRVLNLNDLTYDYADDYAFDHGYVDAGGAYFEDSNDQIAIHQIAQCPMPRRENKTVFYPIRRDSSESEGLDLRESITQLEAPAQTSQRT